MKIKNRINEETEKAVNIAGIWIPKSQIFIAEDVIEIPDWLWKKSGLGEFNEIYKLGNKEYRRIIKDGKFEDALYLNDGHVITSFNEEEDAEQLANFSQIEGIHKQEHGLNPKHYV